MHEMKNEKLQYNSHLQFSIANIHKLHLFEVL